MLKKIRHKEPPNPQTLRNFRNEEPKRREYWFVDGLCHLLLDCSLEQWEQLHQSAQDTSLDQDQEYLEPEESTDQARASTNVQQMPVPSLLNVTVTESPSAIALPDWHKICRERLHAQEQQRLTTNQLTFKDGMAYELDDIPLNLGLVERKKAPKIRDEISPKRSIQPSEYEIGKKFKYSEFLDQVLSTQQQDNATKKTRIAIIGEPGAGKTTLLQKIAFEVDKNGGLPIVVSLGDLRGRNLRQYLLEDWLVDAVPRRITQDVEDDFVEQFNQGRVWLLLDGVDEMATGSLSALDDLKQQLASSFVVRARVVLTCRLNVWDSNLNALETFETYRTLEVSYPEQVGQFIDSWFKKIDPERGQRLKTALAQPEKKRIQDLIKNPLRLALLCRTWQREEGDLPDTKAKLYQQFVDDLYWWKWKYEGFRTTKPQRQELKAKLGQLARDAIAQDSSRFRLLESSISPLLGNRHEEESLFSQACKLGLLIPIGKAAEDTAKWVYAFFHPTFQEYFAACAIPDWDYFLKHVLHNPMQGTYRIFDRQWKEVILLWLGREEDEEFSKQKETFIDALIHFKDGCDHFYSLRSFFLAAAGISEFEDCSKAKAIIEQIVNWDFGYFNANQQVELRFFNIIAEQARAVLRETNREKVIEQVTQWLNSSNQQIKCQAALSLLLEYDFRETKVIDALTELLNDSHDPIIFGVAAFGLLEYNPNHTEAIRILSRHRNISCNDYTTKLLQSERAFYGHIAKTHYGINFSQKGCHMRQNILGGFSVFFNQEDTENSGQGNNDNSVTPNEIPVLIERVRQAQELLPHNLASSWKLLESIFGRLNELYILDESGETTGGSSEVINNLIEEVVSVVIGLVHISIHDYHEFCTTDSFEIAIGYLGVGVNDLRAVKALLEVVNINVSRVQDKQISIISILNDIIPLENKSRLAAIRTLEYLIEKSDEQSLFREAVAGLKGCFQELFNEKNQIYDFRYFYISCYKIIGRCAQKMSYPAFYKAWHD